MRVVDENTLNTLAGSRALESLTVYAWYGGKLAHPDPLPVSGASFNWDRTRQVQTMSLALTDESGMLAPWLFEDPLGVGGSRLQVRHNVGGASPVNVGWYRITSPRPAERWHSYIINEAGRINPPDSPLPTGKKELLVSGGATITLEAADLAVFLKNDRLLAPESPVGTTPTVIGEVRRLVGDTMPVVVAAGVTDQAVNKTLVYERDRLDAIQALLKGITCDYRMTGDGALEVYSLAPATPVYTLRGGTEGLLVEVNREQNLEGLYNIFVADGTGGDTPVRGIAQIETGPLSVKGPHGRYATFYESNMISTQAQADAYARQMRDTHLAGLTVDLKVTCLPVPHLQQGDWVNVGNPVVGGESVTLAGMIKSITQPWNRTVPDRCTVVVECSYTDVRNVIGSVTRG